MPLSRLDRCEPLIGREAELRRLRGLVAEAGRSGGAVTIAGEAGTGKTALLRSALSDAGARGFTTITVSGATARRPVPFSGLQPLLLSYAAEIASLPATERAAIESVLAVDAPSPAGPVAVGRALQALAIAAASDRPILFAVDDLHLLDRASIDAIAEIARRTTGGSLAVICTTRAHRRVGIPAAFGPILHLRPLDESDARRLLERHARHLGYAAREHVLRCAAGNPLAITELPAIVGSTHEAASEIVPKRMPLTPTLQRSFAQGATDLSPAGRDAVLVAAADDETDVLELLAALAAMGTPGDGVEVFDEVLDTGLLIGDELHLAFSHSLVAPAILHEESLARRQRAHRAIAGVLPYGPRRIWHVAQSTIEPSKVVADALEQVHPVALERGVTSAIWVLERSAQLTPELGDRARRLLRAADHGRGLGRADVVESLVSAASRLELTPGEHAHAELIRTALEDGASDEPRIGGWCDLARQLAGDDPDRAIDLLLAAAERAWWIDAGADVRAEIDETARSLDHDADDSRLTAVLALASPVSNGRRVAAQLARVDGANVSDPMALRNFGFAAHLIGDAHRAIALLGHAEVACRSQGLFGLLPQVLCIRSAASIDVGNWDRAHALAAEAAEGAMGTGQGAWAAAATAHLARVTALQGDVDGARQLAGESESLADQRGLRLVRALARVARGAAWLSAGQPLEAFDELVPLFADGPATRACERASATMLLVEAAARIDRLDAVRDIVGELDLLSASTPSPVFRTHLLYARAVTAPDESAEARYVEASDHDLVRWPWVRARTELEYGAWLRRRRRVVECRGYLRAAGATFEAIGAAGWARQAQTELRAAGERPSAPAEPTGEEVLSAQELEIAQLAAAGLSNKEIGQRLYLSHRTVGSHLYRVFPKLGITSRRQLAACLGALGVESLQAA